MVNRLRMANLVIWGDFSYQVKIQIIGLEVCEGFIEGFFDVVGVVVGVPQLAGDLERQTY